jgi:hypothetical protein
MKNFLLNLLLSFAAVGLLGLFCGIGYSVGYDTGKLETALTAAKPASAETRLLAVPEHSGCLFGGYVYF